MAMIWVASLHLYILVFLISDNASYELNKNNKLYSLNSTVQTHDGIYVPDIFATTVDFIKKYGYPVETHVVTTEDGYLLTVHRIPGSPRAASSGDKGPVLISHGMCSSSVVWVFFGPEQGLGFILADQGYDVWLGNFRGNVHSRSHVTLSPNDPKFWNFSWHEMGVYDLPAMIDYILKVTKQPQVFFIGQSMGGTTFFVLTSTRPEYNQKIRLMVSLGAVTYPKNTKSRIISAFSNFYELLHNLVMITGSYEVCPRLGRVQAVVLSSACRVGNPLLEVCLEIMSAITGSNKRIFNKTTAHILFSHMTAGSSANTAIHYLQNIYTGRFQEFDPTFTMGTKTPEYDLLKVTAPVYLMYGDMDQVATPEITSKLSRTLRNVVKVYRVPDDQYGHIDYAISNNVKILVYDEIIAAFNKFQ